MYSNDYGTEIVNGAFTSVSADEVLRTLRSQFMQSLLEQPIAIGSVAVTLTRSQTGQGGFRYWFICPSCGSRVGKLYCISPLLACRHCFAVKYPSSRYKGMVESQLNLAGEADRNAT